MQIVLYQPEIPPNTGNIGRLCAATSTPLHLIKPLGFKLDDRHLKRAGLDYWGFVDCSIWEDWESFTSSLIPASKILLTTKNAKQSLYSYSFSGEELLVFGPEAKGLPEWMLNYYPSQLRIPIWSENVRSLNLANSAAVCLYESYRQLFFNN